MSALEQLDTALTSRFENPEPDEIEVAESTVVRVKKFLYQLNDCFGQETAIPVPYAGASYNGHLVLGWIADSNRIDLEFYKNGSVKGVALINNVQERFTSDDPGSIALRVRQISKQ